MGEYGDIEIDRQMRKMFGVGYEPEQSKPQKLKPVCSCGKHFQKQTSLEQHRKMTGHRSAKNQGTRS